MAGFPNQEATKFTAVNSTVSATVDATSLPYPDFTASESSGSAPLKVTFSYIGNSKAGVLSHVWSFGDGDTYDNGWRPTHIYTKPGVYTVTFTLKNDEGINSLAIENYISAY